MLNELIIIMRESFNGVRVTKKYVGGNVWLSNLGNANYS